MRNKNTYRAARKRQDRVRLDSEVRGREDRVRGGVEVLAAGVLQQVLISFDEGVGARGVDAVWLLPAEGSAGIAAAAVESTWPAAPLSAGRLRENARSEGEGGGGATHFWSGGILALETVGKEDL